MSLVVVIEELAGQHSDLQPPSGRGLPYCNCDGPVWRGEDSCMRCGRYKRGLFRPGLADHSFREWARLVRERPAA